MAITGNAVVRNLPIQNLYSAKIQTKVQLKQYILSKLGSPVINIELTDEQMEYAIDDTLELYFQRAYAGNLERYVPITLLAGVQSYILPFDVFAVLKVHSSELGGLANNAPSNIWGINQFIAADLYRGSGKIDMLTYTMTNNMLATLDVVFRRQISFDFNCISKELLLFEVPHDEKVILHLYKKNVPLYDSDGKEITNLYNTTWIRSYATEKCRLQWSDNLLKYAGSTLPNGLNLDVAAIQTRALDTLTKLDEELRLEWELPIDFQLA